MQARVHGSHTHYHPDYSSLAPCCCSNTAPVRRQPPDPTAHLCPALSGRTATLVDNTRHAVPTSIATVTSVRAPHIISRAATHKINPSRPRYPELFYVLGPDHVTPPSLRAHLQQNSSVNRLTISRAAVRRSHVCRSAESMPLYGHVHVQMGSARTTAA